MPEKPEAKNFVTMTWFHADLADAIKFAHPENAAEKPCCLQLWIGLQDMSLSLRAYQYCCLNLFYK